MDASQLSVASDVIQSGAHNRQLDHAVARLRACLLLLALLYAQAGLLDEAEQELQKANPDSAIARRLLANLQAMRR